MNRTKAAAGFADNSSKEWHVAFTRNPFQKDPDESERGSAAGAGPGSNHGPDQTPDSRGLRFSHTPCFHGTHGLQGRPPTSVLDLDRHSCNRHGYASRPGADHPLRNSPGPAGLAAAFEHMHGFGVRGPVASKCAWVLRTTKLDISLSDALAVGRGF